MDDFWATVHLYFNMAKIGRIPKLKCECGEEYTRAIGKDDLPIFRCLPCDVKMFPPKQLFEEMEMAVKRLNDKN